MKIYQAFILLILTSIYSAKDYCDPSKDTSNPSKAEDCNKANHDGGYCCFVQRKDSKICGEFGPNQYKYIPDMVKFNKKCYDSGDDCEKYDDYSIDCNSSYLVFSSLMIILLFL